MPTNNQFPPEILTAITAAKSAAEILRNAYTAARRLTDTEREAVTRAACRLAGILLDAARAAARLGVNPDTIAMAEVTADDLLRLANRLNGFGEGEEE